LYFTNPGTYAAIISLLFLLVATGCGNVVAPVTCEHTAHESLALLVSTANPDSSYIVQDTIPADPACRVGDPWVIGDAVGGSCVCMA
jgi:hypothetical protein